MTDGPPVEYLDGDDLLALATALLGHAAPVRDVGLLGSAAARPQATAFGADAYPDIWTKAAALLQSIVNNHALVDGNKRLGWLATAVFLSINGHGIAHAANDDVYDLVIEIATHRPGPRRHRPSAPGAGSNQPLTPTPQPCTPDRFVGALTGSWGVHGRPPKAPLSSNRRRHQVRAEPAMPHDPLGGLVTVER